MSAKPRGTAPLSASIRQPSEPMATTGKRRAPHSITSRGWRRPADPDRRIPPTRASGALARNDIVLQGKNKRESSPGRTVGADAQSGCATPVRRAAAGQRTGSIAPASRGGRRLRRAAAEVFETLDWLEARLARRALPRRGPADRGGLAGGHHALPLRHRLSRALQVQPRRLVEYPKLWGYARELYQVPKVAGTVNFEHIARHYYSATRASIRRGSCRSARPSTGWSRTDADSGPLASAAERREGAAEPGGRSSS